MRLPPPKLTASQKGTPVSGRAISWICVYLHNRTPSAPLTADKSGDGRYRLPLQAMGVLFGRETVPALRAAIGEQACSDLDGGFLCFGGAGVGPRFVVVGVSRPDLSSARVMRIIGD